MFRHRRCQQAFSFPSIKVLCENLSNVKPQTPKEGAGLACVPLRPMIQLAAKLRRYGIAAASVKPIGRAAAQPNAPLSTLHCNLIILQTISLCGGSMYMFYDEEGLFKPTLKHLTQLSPSVLNSNAPCTPRPAVLWHINKWNVCFWFFRRALTTLPGGG